MSYRRVILLILVFLFPLLNANLCFADQTRAFSFGFKKSRNGSFPSIAEEGFLKILKEHKAIFLGDPTKKELFLTFDNGYEKGFTPKILDILKTKRVPAAFFVTGHYVKTKPKLIKRMIQEGHLVGNHSWNHPNLAQMRPEQVKQEMQKVQAQIAQIYPLYQMQYMRPPRGVFSAQLLKQCLQLGYTTVLWSVAYKDWDVNAQQGWKHAYNQVTNQLHPGAVILLHAISKDNTEALSHIVDQAHKKGYTFKSLNDLHKKTYQ